MYFNLEVDFYCLNYNNNSERKKKIEEKGRHFQIPIIFYSGVSREDNRISFITNENIQRTASICYGHLDMLKHFVENSKKDLAIIMEDDIMIRKTFTEDLEKVIDVFKTNNYDILLLGYLCYNPIDTYINCIQYNTPYSSDNFKIMSYPDDSWGTQMYIISKKQCIFLLNKYYHNYLEKSLLDSSVIPFSADWTITKEGKRALLYPMRVIENYKEGEYDDIGQERCRKLCNLYININDYI